MDNAYYLKFKDITFPDAIEFKDGDSITMEYDFYSLPVKDRTPLINDERLLEI